MNKLCYVLLLASILCVGEVNARSAVARSGNDSVTISDTPCTSTRAMGLLPEVNKILKVDVKASALGKATVVIGGTIFEACWLSLGDQVLIMDEDVKDNIYPIPAAAFVEPAAI